MATRPPTIAVDFDGTIVDFEQGWQGIGNFGEVKPKARERLQQLKKEGWLIIIFTCRSEVALIADFLKRQGVPFDQINKNENLPHVVPGYGLEKVIADVYLDDRAVYFDGDWDKAYHNVKRFMEKHGPLGLVKG